ncbi:MAG: hypothetical protein ABFS12_08095 [Bacteroidota bacterium]
MLKQIKIISILIICLSTLSQAQDTQYWSKQYGTYGGLLGNTVIGAISDLSSTYYNPGAMAFSKDSSLVLTTSSFQFIYLNFNNILNSNLKLDYWYTNASQGIFALRLPYHWLGDDQIVISYLARQDFNFNSTGRSITPYYNDHYKSDQLSIDQNLNEYWYGLTWSKPINSKLGFGSTMYLAYRSQKLMKQTITQSYDVAEETKNFTSMIDLNYYNYRLLWKFGISYQMGKLMLGLSLTTPSINISGSGNASMLISRANADSLQNKTPEFISNSQENLTAYYKSPISIGFGGAYYWRNTVLYFSAEWFNRVKDFLVMEPSSFIGQSSERTINYNVNYSLKSVFNFGIGIKYIFSDNFIYYGGISTDESAYNPESFNPFVLSTWDIVHIRSGAEFKFHDLSITLGFSYGYSGELFGNFNLFGIFKNSKTDVIYNQMDVILGLTYSM